MPRPCCPRIPMPMSRAALTIVLREAVRRNRIREGLLYLQVGRGVAPRGHAFPDQPVAPSVVITVSPVDRAATEAKAAKGVKVITTPENRWGRCDIKTVGLLPNALAKQAAKERGAAEALSAPVDGQCRKAARCQFLCRGSVFFQIFRAPGKQQHRAPVSARPEAKADAHPVRCPGPGRDPARRSGRHVPKEGGG